LNLKFLERVGQPFWLQEDPRKPLSANGKNFKFNLPGSGFKGRSNKRMFKTIKNAFKTPDVRKRMLYTLLLIVIFRLGSFITVPGVDTLRLDEFTNQMTSGISGLIDIISRRS